MADFLSIEDTLAVLNITPGMSAAEFGCGLAAFTLALAKKLKRGRVFALDIQEEKLSALKSQLSAGRSGNGLAEGKLNNIVTILCDLESPAGSTLKANSLDIVVIPNLLFQSENKYDIIKEAWRILKNHGQCLVLEWLNSNHLVATERLASPEEIKNVAQDVGFSITKEFAAGDYHYGVVLVK